MAWSKGQSGNPLGARLRIAGSEELELRRLAQKWTRPALAKIIRVMRGTSDDKTALLAANMILERGHGKPIQPHSNPDLSPLNWAEMSTEDLMAAMQRLQDALGDHADNQLPAYNPMVHVPSVGGRA